MAEVEGLRVFPVKGLEGVEVEQAEVLEGGTLERDREYAVFDGDGEVVNGKRTPRVHRLGVELDGEPVVSFPDGTKVALDDAAQGEERLGDWFGVDANLSRDGTLGYVDRRGMGPSVVSTATLHEVASWYDGISVEGMRRRLRANVEVSGVSAFWEDRFVGDDAPSFEVGDVRFEGVTPCGRCIVPARNPDTGEETDGFRETFVEKRRETFPEWADGGEFKHMYTVMLIARVAEENAGESISVGDDVRIVR